MSSKKLPILPGEPHGSVLRALHRVFDDPNSTGRFMESDIPKLTRPGLNAGIVRASLRVLFDEGFVSEEKATGGGAAALFSGASDRFSWQLTAKGAEVIYSEINEEKKFDQIDSEKDFIQIGKVDANGSQALKKIKEIENILETANDLPLDYDQREMFKAELGPIKRMLETGLLRVGAILGAIRGSGVLASLAKKVGEHSLSATIKAAIDALAELVGIK